jgi:CHAT domain-containing protein
MEPVDESASSLRQKIDEADACIQFCIETGDDPTPVINAKFLLEGQLAEALNDFPAASMAYERSVDGFRLAGCDKEVAIFALKAARTNERIENHKKAFDFCQEAVDALESLRAKTPFAARLLSLDLSVKTFDFAIKIAHICNEDHQVFSLIQKAKSRCLNDMIARKQDLSQLPNFSQVSTNSDQQARSRFYRATADLDQGWDLYFNEQIEQASLTALEEKLNQEFINLDADSSENKDYLSTFCNSATTYNIEDIQKILVGNEAMLEFFVQENGIYIVIICADQFKVVLKPLSANDVKDIALMLHLNLIQSKNRHAYMEELRAQDEPERIEFMEQIGEILYQDPKILLQELYDLLFGSLLKELEDITRIIICPHWILYLVPFHAMGGSIANGDLVINHKAFTYCPSATIWARLRNASKRNEPVRFSKSLVFGVEKKTSANWFQGVLEFFSRIRGDIQLSDFEAEAIDVASDLKVSAVIGSAATKTQFFDRFPNSDIVHLSCHSALKSAQKSTNGLLFADGILTIAEILMDQRIGTSRPELIALSACRSGLDVIYPGDQLGGIGPAFMAHCGSNILGSLWPVHSEATRILMETLYENYQISKDWAEALRQAQLITMNSNNRSNLDFHEPYFWSAFFIMGH